MTNEQAVKILKVWDQQEINFPHKSTEFLLEVTADRCRRIGIMPRCDCSDVAEAIFRLRVDQAMSEPLFRLRVDQAMSEPFTFMPNPILKHVKCSVHKHTKNNPVACILCPDKAAVTKASLAPLAQPSDLPTMSVDLCAACAKSFYALMFPNRGLAGKAAWKRSKKKGRA